MPIGYSLENRESSVHPELLEGGSFEMSVLRLGSARRGQWFIFVLPGADSGTRVNHFVREGPKASARFRL
jgi:hypothetical protein